MFLKLISLDEATFIQKSFVWLILTFVLVILFLTILHAEKKHENETRQVNETVINRKSLKINVFDSF